MIYPLTCAILVVEFSLNYQSTNLPIPDHLMSVFRAFIAVDLSPEILKQLEQVARDLKQNLENLPIRWVPTANIHVTLKFLGDVSVSNVAMLEKIIQSTASGHHHFTISVGGLGVFPSKRRPRVVWVGVETPAEMKSVHRGIEIETARLGYRSENRLFKPHLTLGRVSRNAGPRDVRMISQALEEKKVGLTV
ncbi:MAG: RNA 2',3'-cyclic phosphodiesterase, partial [Anaerolineales bacterium]